MYIGGTGHRRIVALAFLAPAVASLAVFSLFPIISSALLSFMDFDPLKPVEMIKFVGLSNYVQYFSSNEVWAQYSHVLYYLILYIPLIIASSMIQALLLNRAFAAKSFYKVLFFLPVISSWVAVALIWRWLLHGEYGLINIALDAIGIQGPSWIHSQTWAMPSIVLAAAWKDTGYYALILLAALKSVNRNYYEAAVIDGASAFQRFWKITVPLISPTIFLLIVINVISGFQVFESIYIMTEGGPAGATRVPVEQVYRNAFTYYRMGYASAVAWALGIVIMIITAIQFRLEKKWVNYES